MRRAIECWWFGRKDVELERDGERRKKRREGGEEEEEDEAHR